MCSEIIAFLFIRLYMFYSNLLAYLLSYSESIFQVLKNVRLYMMVTFKIFLKSDFINFRALEKIIIVLFLKALYHWISLNMHSYSRYKLYLSF
jgi:type III secretory pathway component EscS